MTHFLLKDNHFLNLFGFEIIGTILILIGLIITRRIYPFIFTFFAELLTYVILIMNILNFIFYKNYTYQQIQYYSPFVMSLSILLISKILENGLRYFGNVELARKWRYFSIIIFFGFSLQYYLYTSLYICGFIRLEHITLNLKLILLFLPFGLLIIFFFLYYLWHIILSFKFLLKTQSEYDSED